MRNYNYLTFKPKENYKRATTKEDQVHDHRE